MPFLFPMIYNQKIWWDLIQEANLNKLTQLDILIYKRENVGKIKIKIKIKIYTIHKKQMTSNKNHVTGLWRKMEYCETVKGKQPVHYWGYAPSNKLLQNKKICTDKRKSAQFEAHRCNFLQKPRCFRVVSTLTFPYTLTPP